MRRSISKVYRMTDNKQNTLSDQRPGKSYRILKVTGAAYGHPDSSFGPEEVERRLLEAGFFEGEIVEILHEGPVSADPIAVQVNGALVALRRREATAIIVEPMVDNE